MTPSCFLRACAFDTTLQYITYPTLESAPGLTFRLFLPPRQQAAIKDERQTSLYSSPFCPWSKINHRLPSFSGTMNLTVASAWNDAQARC